MIAVSYGRQLLPGTFEHALSYLIDHEIDLDRTACPLRSQAKVDTQWKLFCIVHNVAKLQVCGKIAA